MAGARLAPEVKALLTARNIAHVATLMKDGAPQVAPVWIDVLGDDRLAFFSIEDNLKVRNLRRDPRVAVSVADEHNPYRSVIVRGQVVEELRGEAANEIVDRLSRRYVGRDYPDRTMLVMVIEPERVRLQDLDPLPPD